MSHFLRKPLIRALALTGIFSAIGRAQTLSPKWEDLTSADFSKALQKADGVCVLPMGSIEKFGPSAPVGTNLYLVRIITLEAAKQDYTLVFPDYFVAQTSDTSVLPGTVHYSMETQLSFLKETVAEMARNGCSKIILANGHTGNNSLISFYMASLMETPHTYAVYNIYASGFPIVGAMNNQLPPAAKSSKPGVDGHGGEERVAAVMAYHPELIHTDRAHDEPTSIGHGPQEAAPGTERPNALPAGHVGPLPTGYSGDAAGATPERGHALVDFAVDKMVKFTRAVKADTDTLANQKLYYEHFEHPQNTPGAK